MLLLGLASAATVELVRDTFPVHEKVTVQLLVTAGPEGLHPGDLVRIEEPQFHGMRWAKWGYVQTDPELCIELSEDSDRPSVGLVRASAPGLELRVRHNIEGPGIHQEGRIDVEVISGELQEGEQLLVELGVLGNDCGWQTSDRALDRIPLKTWLNEQSLGAPELRFAAVPQVDSSQVLLPSQGVVGEPLILRRVELDRYGNALSVETEAILFEQPGVFRVEGSNPIRVTVEPPALSVYWGDLHTHHGHSYTLDDGSHFDANHDYARSVGFDFGCESVKAYPTELRYAEVWEANQRSCRELTDESYVALLGFEWMGGGQQGHHNVYFDGCEAPLAPQALETLDDGLWPYVEQVMEESGLRAVTVPHAPSYTGFNWESRDDELRPLVEVYSEWGSSMDPADAGSVPQALSQGHKLGFIASSDNHDGWLGNGLASKNVAGGVAAIVATELSPAALLDAMASRSTYATTGARILLDLQVQEQDGDTVLDWSVHGTEVVREVHLMAVGVGSPEPAVSLATSFPGALDASGSFAVPWGPEELVVWLEVGQVDRHQAWSSPIWLEREAVDPRGCSSAPWWSGLLLPLIVLVRWRT